ncbi:hypothetical protein [Halobacillus naozhouensis]|uniref:Uncharacterized protein n=1 Tax=Halobacillus naozhouensis TaxID=554880 RepID=A0ABY8J6S9_9BACI|nr:hypothetical protein [Halobacillus naozhouensis]WFT77108.1 hypothetical protein P9989_21490 [Halobacillus naozhouensis]
MTITIVLALFMALSSAVLVSMYVKSWLELFILWVTAPLASRSLKGGKF